MVGRFRRLGAALALLAFVSGVLLPGAFVVHGPDDADAAWGAPGLIAGHATTQLEPVLPPVDDEHCAICHWMRALTHSVSGAVDTGPEIHAAGIVLLPSGPAVRYGVASPSPARAPPIGLL